jgi:hypothetical protein
MDNPVIDKYGNKFWYDTDGKLHRDDGPAIERANGRKSWYLHKKCISFDEWLDKVNIPDEAKVMMKLKYG